VRTRLDAAGLVFIWFVRAFVGRAQTVQFFPSAQAV